MSSDNNNMWRRLRRTLLPPTLWTERFTAAWLTSMATIVTFYLLWCAVTTFRSLSFAGTWINALCLATLFALPAVVSRRGWIWLVVLLLFDALALSNILYCRTYFNSIPLHSYALAGNLVDFTSSVTDSLAWTDLLLPAVSIAGYCLSRRRPDSSRRPSARAYAATLGVLALAAALTAMCYGGVVRHIRHLKSECHYSTTPIVIYTPFLNLLVESMETPEQLTPEMEARVEAWMASRPTASPDSTLALTDADRRDNLVVIVCESLESWPIGATVEGQELTPTLNALVADSTTFYAPHVLSQVGNGRSIDGQLLMLAGMHPLRDFVYSMRFPDNRYRTLATAMKERKGAHTHLLTGDKPSVWNLGQVARSFGIDSLVMRDSWDNSELTGNPKKLADESFFRQSVGKMKAGELWPDGQHAYIQMNTYSCHSPFRIPDKHKMVRFSDAYPQKLADYMTVVNYTDHSLAQFIDYLRSRPDWERTMVMIVGDHEALASWRGEILRSPQAAEVVAAESFVPLIVVNAPAPMRGRNDAVMGQIDVYPTMLQMLGLTDYDWQGLGTSAFSPSAPGFAIDYQGNVVGDTSGADETALRRVDEARDVSDILIRFNMMSHND